MDFSELQAKVRAMNYDNSGMEDACGKISGASFFPAGIGGISSAPLIPRRSIMVLGNDQDTKRGLKKSIDEGDETYSPTWKNIEDLFGRSGINLDDCFFTNAIMGVRTNSKSNVGRSPALNNSAFMRQCIDLLNDQIEFQRPGTIICLGYWPLRLLSTLSSDMSKALVGIEKFKILDENDLAIQRDVRFNDNNLTTTVVALVHPSNRKLNLQWRGLVDNGSDPEAALLKRALKNS